MALQWMWGLTAHSSGLVSCRQWAKRLLSRLLIPAALSSRQVIRLERGQIAQSIGPTFDDLNPMAGRRVLQNKHALALIVGISDYERTDAPAIYADKDAQYFHDYASLKLGISDQNITTLVNDKAEQGDVSSAVKLDTTLV